MTRVRTVVVGVVAALAVLVLVLTVLIVTLWSRWADGARARLVAALSEQFDAEVTLDDLRVQVFPGLRAEGRGLTVRHRGRQDVPPLLSIAHFSAEGSIAQLLRKHVSRLDLDGLDIEIPPDHDIQIPPDHDTKAPADSTHARKARKVPQGLVIDQVFSNSARLA